MALQIAFPAAPASDGLDVLGAKRPCPQVLMLAAANVQPGRLPPAGASQVADRLASLAHEVSALTDAAAMLASASSTAAAPSSACIHGSSGGGGGPPKLAG